MDVLRPRNESGPVMRLNFLHRPRPVGALLGPTGIFSGFFDFQFIFSGTEGRLLSLYYGMVTPVPIKWNFFSFKLPLWVIFRIFFIVF